MKYDGNYPDIIIDGHMIQANEQILKRIRHEEFQSVLACIRHLSDFTKIEINRRKRTVKTVRQHKIIVNDKVHTAGIIGAYRY